MRSALACVESPFSGCDDVGDVRGEEHDKVDHRERRKGFAELSDCFRSAATNEAVKSFVWMAESGINSLNWS